MFRTPLGRFLRKAHSRRMASSGTAAHRRPTRRLEVEFLENRLVPSGMDKTYTDIMGFVTLTGPVHDVLIKNIEPMSYFTLIGDAHDVTVESRIPATSGVILVGNVHDVKTRDIAGYFNLTGNAHDVTMGNISGLPGLFLSGLVILGSTSASSLHDFKAGDISNPSGTGGSLRVNGTFHNGTVGKIYAGGTVSLYHIGHHFRTESQLGPFDATGTSSTAEGGTLHVDMPADESNVQGG